MAYLICTNAVQQRIGLEKESMAEAGAVSAPLGNWYAHRFKVGRRHAYIFMSSNTLASFVLLENGALSAGKFAGAFLAGLAQLLGLLGFSEAQIEQAVSHYHQGLFAKASNRSDLGSLNDLVSLYKFHIESEGGILHCNMGGIILDLNAVPQRKLGWRLATEAVRAAVEGAA